MSAPLLTPSQLTVVRQVAQGKMIAEIAEYLFVSVDTVKSHMHAASRRLGASGRANLVALAIKAGLLEEYLP